MQSPMADQRVYPAAYQHPAAAEEASAADFSVSGRLLPKLFPLSSPAPKSPLKKDAATSPGPQLPPTYVIQIPKEQILSYPPPENAQKYDILTRRKPRRIRFCLCVTLGALLILILTAAIAAGVFYLVFRPKELKYTIMELSVRGMNLTSLSPMEPEFDISIRAENPNKKIGIDYQSGSEVEVSYGAVSLANGVLPVFYQPSNNVTVFQTVLKGSNVILANDIRLALDNDRKQAKVLLTFNVKVPVKIKVGSVKTWKITVTVTCDVTVGALDGNANIVSKDCHYSVKFMNHSK